MIEIDFGPYLRGELRPTLMWRARRRQEAEDVAAGRLAPDKAYVEQLYPDGFVAAVDQALDTFEAGLAVAGTDAAAYPAIMSCVKDCVLALNRLSDETELIETDERELLCAFIEAAIERHGVDPDELSFAQGCAPEKRGARHQLTDRWRAW